MSWPVVPFVTGIILRSVNSYHSYVLFVYCFTLVLSSLSSFYFFVYCVFYVWLPVLAKLTS